MRRRSLRWAALGMVAFGCSEELDCSSVSCLAPAIVVEAEGTCPAGASAELCGRGSQCVTVPLGVPTREPSGVPLAAQPEIDRRRFREDLVRGTTDVRILDEQGGVLATGTGSVVSMHRCCAGARVRFPA